MHAFHLPEECITGIYFGIKANRYDVHRIVRDFDLEGAHIGRKRRGSYDVNFELFTDVEDIIAGA